MTTTTNTTNNATVEIRNGKFDFTKLSVCDREKFMAFKTAVCTVASVHDECHTLCEKWETVKATDLKSLLDKDTNRDIDEIRDSYEKASKKVDEYTAVCNELSDKIAETKKALTVYVDAFEVHKAYKTYMGTMNQKPYTQCIANCLDAMGIEPASKGINYLIRKIGERALSDKEIMKLNGSTTTGALRKPAFTELFCRLLSDLVVSKVDERIFAEYNARVKAEAEAKKAEAKKKSDK